jgi:peptide/nickel transport system substrate-binding protein
MIAALLQAQSREEVVAAVRALDRLLISGFYVVPLFYVPEQWVARWTYIEHPPAISLHGIIPETWWRAPQTQ